MDGTSNVTKSTQKTLTRSVISRVLNGSLSQSQIGMAPSAANPSQKQDGSQVGEHIKIDKLLRNPSLLEREMRRDVD